MKTSTLLLIGVGVVALLHFANLGIAAGVLQYYIANVDFTGISTGKITLMVQNPSNATIVVNSMAGTIIANNTLIGNISNFQGGVEIPANSETPVTIYANLSLTGIISNLYSVLITPTGTNAVDFVIAGNININGGEIIPFNITQTVNV